MPSGCGCAGSSCACQINVVPPLKSTGTGNASSPQIIELDVAPRTVQHVSSGTLDLSGQPHGSVVVVTLLANATSVVLPGATASSLDVVFVQGSPGGFTVTFPATILFAGTDPVVTATNGARDWFRFVNITSAWLGTRLAANLT